jgi:hypothetical protein
MMIGQPKGEGEGRERISIIALLAFLSTSTQEG